MGDLIAAGLSALVGAHRSTYCLAVMEMIWLQSLARAETSALRTEVADAARRLTVS